MNDLASITIKITSSSSTTSQGYNGASGIPTPPSHHSHVSGGGLGGVGGEVENSPASAVMSVNGGGAPSLDHYLTPSPDSPGQWSSTTSPHSVATSDWSDGVHSPPQHHNHHLINHNNLPTQQQNAQQVREGVGEAVDVRMSKIIFERRCPTCL